jgi:hypothetical protein
MYCSKWSSCLFLFPNPVTFQFQPSSSLFNPVAFQFPDPVAFLFPPLLLDGRGVLDAAAVDDLITQIIIHSIKDEPIILF